MNFIYPKQIKILKIYNKLIKILHCKINYHQINYSINKLYKINKFNIIFNYFINIMEEVLRTNKNCINFKLFTFNNTNKYKKYKNKNKHH